MHLIVRDGASLDEIGEPQDLGLAPADFILLSFSDSDLATFRAATQDPLIPSCFEGGRPPHPVLLPKGRRHARTGVSLGAGAPSPLRERAGASAPSPLGERVGVRGSSSAHFINLAALRHPISADLFIEKTVPGTKAILLRLLGGLDYWRYGAEELAHACRKHGVTLAVLSGDGRADPRLPPLSTVEAAELDALDRLLSVGGPQNAGIAISALMARGGAGVSSSPVDALPEFGVYRENGTATGGSAAIIFYRSFLLAGDVRPVDALFDTLASLPSPCPSPAQARLGELASLESPHPRADADGRGDAFSAGTACPLSHGERAGVRGESSELAVHAYYLPSLKAAGAAEWLREQFRRNPPDAIINTTAFSARGRGCGLAARRRGLPRHSSRAGGKLRGGVAQILARAVLDRSRDARRAAGTRRAHLRGRDLVQGPRCRRRCLPPAARARHRTRCRPRRCVGALAADGAARQEARADPLHLPRPPRPDRARRRPRWPGQRFETRAASAGRGI